MTHSCFEQPEPAACHRLGACDDSKNRDVTMPAPVREACATTASRRGSEWRAWLTPGALLVVLAMLTANVLTGGPLVGLDQRVREVVRADATSVAWRWIAGPASLIVNLGDLSVAIPALLLTALLLAARRRDQRPLLSAAAAIGLLQVAVVPAKILIGRSAPGYAHADPGALGAFPSGHAATAGVCYGVAVLLLAPGLPVRVRRAVTTAVIAVCFLVGLSLVWCDDHWLTDVVAGWALAGIIVRLIPGLTSALVQVRELVAGRLRRACRAVREARRTRNTV